MIEGVDEGGAFVLVLHTDRLDAAHAPSFRANALPLVADKTLVVLDLRHVQFVDSTGLGCIVAVQKRITPHGRLRLANVGPRVAALLRLTGLERVFPTFPSVEMAAAAA